MLCGSVMFEMCSSMLVCVFSFGLSLLVLLIMNVMLWLFCC